MLEDSLTSGWTKKLMKNKKREHMHETTFKRPKIIEEPTSSRYAKEKRKHI